MLKTRVLTTVSAIALATAVGATAAKADNLVVDLSVPSQTITAASSSIDINSVLLTLGSSDDAVVVNTAIGFPVDPTDLHDLAGGTDTIIVDSVNNIFAEAGSNEVINQLDFFAATGSGDSSAATLGSFQGSDSSDVTASVDNSNVLAQVLDLGAGSTVRVNDNEIGASGTVNDAENLLFGDINPNLTSTEIGQADIDAGTGLISAGATALAGNVQVVQGAASTFAFISDSRIGLLAQTSTEPNISGVPLDLTGNSIAAAFTGNDASTAVALTGDEAITLVGTVGAVNAQTASGDYLFRAEVDSVVIEGANTQDFLGAEYIADLSSSTLTVQDNEISATSSANQAVNSVSLDENINLEGVPSSRLNTFDAGPDTASVNGDIFVANAQYSDVSVLADVNEGDINVLTGDAAGSTIIADDNTISATATGSGVSNSLEVGNTADFSALVAINSVQYTEGTQTAANDSFIVLDTGSTDATDDSVTDSSLTVDGNAISSEAMGNSHSSSIDITGTTVTGAGSLIINPIISNRGTTSGGVSADFSLLSAQVLDGGSATADVLTQIDVDAGDEVFTTSELSVSGNDIHGLAIGNLSTEASIAIDATTLTGTVALASVQTVEDGALLSSTIAPQGAAFITVDVGSGNGGIDDAIVTEAAIHADGNTINSRVWGNLADSTTNSIEITGVTAESGSHAIRSAASVSRGGPVSFTAVDHSIALLNDQSVEDLEGSVVTASATGDLINVVVGNLGGVSEVTNSVVTASENLATTAATLNQATSEVTVDVTTLDSSSALVNVQTLADEDGDDDSASIDVSQTDLDITVDVLAGDVDMEDVTVQANGNEILASGRVNLATNSMSIDAQTQTLTGTIDTSVIPVAPITPLTAVSLSDSGTYAQAENLLINEQSFDALGTGAGPLGGDGLSVTATDNDITVDIGIAGMDLLNSTVEVDGNSVRAVAAGNDAANSLAMDVGTFVLDAVDLNGGLPDNGPIAAIASNQTGTAGVDTGGILAGLSNTTIAVDASDASTNNILGTNISVDGNAVRALARSNNVTNELTATGTTVDAITFGSPDSQVGGPGGVIQLDETVFSVGSRQVSSVDMISTVVDTVISAQAGDIFGADPIGGSISGASITADTNVIVAEARGNDGVNTLTTDFVLNQGQASVANSQIAGGGDPQIGPLSYDASVLGAQITVLTDVDGAVTSSAFSASENAIAALSSANRATNTLNADGTNVGMVNGNNTATVEPTAGVISTDAALAVLNMQGEPSLSADPVSVSATVGGALIGVGSNGLFDSGSVTADANLILAQAVEHSANNSLNLTASANIGVDPFDGTPGASIVSLQTISAGSSVTADVDTSGIAAIVDDPRSDLSFAASASNNQILATAIGGTATNRLVADAGAEITSLSGSSPLMGNGLTPIELNAGFNVLNAQQAAAANFDASIGTVGIAAGGAEDYLNDAVSVNDNIVQAQANAFMATNVLVLDAGSSSDATAAIANSQIVIESGVSTDIDGVVILTGNLDEGAEFSSLTVGGNQVNALSTANQATNVLNTLAAATLQESSGAGAVIDPTDTNPIQVTGADYAILNYQTTTGSTVTADISTVGIGIDGLEATTGVNNSALNVEGNQVLASAVGNDAVNSMTLTTGTFAHPSASIANLQTNTGSSMSASVDGVAIGIGGVGTTIGATSSNSSFSVQGNSIGASAIGNRAVNSLTSGN
jgi:hypothetical protein